MNSNNIINSSESSDNNIDITDETSLGDGTNSLDLFAKEEGNVKIYNKTEWKVILKINDLDNTPFFEVQANLREGIPSEL